MVSKTNMICRDCKYYQFLYFDSGQKAIFKCLNKEAHSHYPSPILVALNKQECQYKEVFVKKNNPNNNTW